MKRNLTIVMLLLLALTTWAQGSAALDQLKGDPRKSYGTDYPYSFANRQLTKAPKGYKPFYISHYGRHGSRYYWNAMLYQELANLLTKAHERGQLTPAGEAFFGKFMAAKEELQTGVSELSELGWQQHQFIARTMYNNFPEVFKKGGNVLAIASLSGRCPSDRQNPKKRQFPKATPRWEKNKDKFPTDESLRDIIVKRTFTSTDSLPGNLHHIGSNLINLYTSLPSIGHEGMMDGLVSDEEIAAQWEQSNLGSYSWVFEPQNEMIPILQDIIAKASAVLDGSSDRIADLRFGHDTCLGPLTVLMGINGADKDPEDPYEVKNCYQNWQTGKASNIQLVFYRSKKASDDVLVKCLLNGQEAKLPVPTDCYPYYKWTDFKQYYTSKIAAVKTN